MTIQEAIKSGKPFRRKDKIHWLLFADILHDNVIYDTLKYRIIYNSMHYFTIEDILARDWEVKDE